MDKGTLDLSGLIGKLTSDPEALGNAMRLAQKLKESGALDSVIGADQKPSYSAGEDAYIPKEQPKKDLSPFDRTDRQKLLQALRPFLSRQRREKLDAVLRVSGLIETARRLGAPPSEEKETKQPF